MPIACANFIYGTRRVSLTLSRHHGFMEATVAKGRVLDRGVKRIQQFGGARLNLGSRQTQVFSELVGRKQLEVS